MLARRRFLGLAVGAATLPRATRCARAQASNQIYPVRPVRLVVGLAAGGGTDVVARLMADALTQQLGQQFFVENRTGLAGNLATQAVTNSPPDGYTLLFVGPSNTISPSVYKNLSFDFLRDTVAVAGVMRFPNLMVVPPSLPVHTVQEFIDYAKDHPGKLSMASSGVGASPHLSGELFKLMTGVEMVHVPYRGSAAVYPDLMAGTVHVLFDNLPGAIGLVQAGKLRAVGVTSAERWDALPEIPAIAETVPGYQVDVWYGISAPRGVAPQIVAILNQAVNAALAEPKLIARFAELGGKPMPMSSEQMAQFVAQDVAKWAKVVQFAKIKPE
ncbi:MAG TPA: tripartite tricarboxylate transporter substrate binding protein [Xanthobacteraceae bacterium]|jgi:tripartite-type tricarboxylate transporter receptor subunit TctC|nr:tripartite tricarboxylate transporter substrate binding protein [Xanthobacteraceae bacterium]